MGGGVLGHRRGSARPVGLGTARILCGEAMQRHSAKIPCSWALQGASVVGHEVGHCRDFLLFGIAGILANVLRLRAAGILCS